MTPNRTADRTPNFATATNHAPLAARFNPVAANGRSRKLIASGRVIQVGFGRKGTVRMSVGEAREFAAALLDMAAPMLPHQVLAVKYRPRKAKHHRSVRVRAGDVLPFAGSVMRACTEAEIGTLFAGAGR